ncbi:hypothetical protein [Leucobacter sp. CX169]|uniref:hypothetical protein n=1 Tax=Leucobacter sp. CX169 TaxID=2813744 RepID=UPI0019D2A3D6|nr:hypothetical protein [Leucobacter sp. CX169]
MSDGRGGQAAGSGGGGVGQGRHAAGRRGGKAAGRRVAERTNGEGAGSCDPAPSPREMRADYFASELCCAFCEK